MTFAIITDIEGTTSSISFVKEVLFPYARERISSFIRQHATDPLVLEALRDIERISQKSLTLDECNRILLDWIDEDIKATPLKTLQGLIWEEGYTQGHFQGHLYPDAAACLNQWHTQGFCLYVFSSGSIKAQKLLFGHTHEGDLTPLFKDFFDTTTGPKLESSSYQSLSQRIEHRPEKILFLSDIEGELDAALKAGLKTVQLIRDPSLTPSDRHPKARNFHEIHPERLFS